MTLSWQSYVKLSTSEIEIESVTVYASGSDIKAETELRKKLHSKNKKRREDVEYKIHFISLWFKKYQKNV